MFYFIYFNAFNAVIINLKNSINLGIAYIVSDS